MSSSLIIEWLRDELRAATVSADGRVIASTHQRDAAHAESGTPIAEAAEAIRGWLNQSGIAPGKATVVLPREAVVVRRLQLPAAPPEELPDLVRFQTATKTSAPIEQLAIDFLSVESRQEEGQAITAVMLDRSQLTRMQSVLSGAGVDVERVTISPLTTTQLIRKNHPDAGVMQPDLVVFQQGSRLEISILEQGTLVFSHATQLPDEQNTDHLKPLRSEINRSLVAMNQWHPDVSIGRCFYVSGSADAEVISLLRERFKSDTVIVHPESAPGFETLLGAALPADPRLHLDLLHPRERPVIPDRRKWYLGGGIAAAVLLLFIGYLYYRGQMNQLKLSIENLQATRLSQEADLKKYEPTVAAHARVEKWKQSDSDIAMLWNTLLKHLPDTDRVYFTQLHIVPEGGETLARFTGTGFARARGDVEYLNQTLAENNFRVTPKAIQNSRRDPDYPLQFELDVELLRPQPESASQNPNTTQAVNLN